MGLFKSPEFVHSFIYFLYLMDFCIVFVLVVHSGCCKSHPEHKFIIIMSSQNDFNRILISCLQETALKKPREVFRLPADLIACDNRLCASIHFTSSSWVTLSDGTGRLYLIRTGKRGDGACEKWEVG